jgi:hypothetical protein
MNRMKSWRSWRKKGCVARCWDSMAAAQGVVTAGGGRRYGPWPWRRVMHEPSGGTAVRTSVGPGGRTLPGATAGPTENSDVVARSTCCFLVLGSSSASGNYSVTCWSLSSLPPDTSNPSGRAIGLLLRRRWVGAAGTGPDSRWRRRNCSTSLGSNRTTLPHRHGVNSPFRTQFSNVRTETPRHSATCCLVRSD